MVATPWGDSDSLRERKLQPVRGASPEEVSRIQRERLFAAMVACVSERGYGATAVSDLLSLSGVSSRSFYGYFPDKGACLKATVEAILSLAQIEDPDPDGTETLEAWARSRLGTLGAAVIAQPAAAKLCLIEAFADPQGVEPITAALEAVERDLRRHRHDPEEAELPPKMITARVGGLVEVARSRLRRGAVEELPALTDGFVALLLADQAPPEPLRMTTRPMKGEPESLGSAGHAERAVRAFSILVAEQGYFETTVDDVLKKASMSPTTFYANFSGKDDLMASAIDGACAQIVAAAMPAFARHSDWPSAIRASYGALLSFLASRPALAHLIAVDVYAAGEQAIERRFAGLRPLAPLFENSAPWWRPPLFFEATAGAILHLAYTEVRDSGPDSLPALAPLCTYLSLAPFIGAEAACVAANGTGGGRAAPVAEAAVPFRMTMRATVSEALVFIADNEASPQEVAVEVGEDVEVVRGYLTDLAEVGALETVEENDAGEPVYRSNRDLNYLLVLTAQQMKMMPTQDRDDVSRQIWRLASRDVEEALESGTFNARAEHVLTRSPVQLDELGWSELTRLHEQILHATFEIQARAKKRLDETGERAIPGRSLQLFFEMPVEDD